ncbi:hypothetical protein HYFRA_00001181 [Hymenoscyphus fraxineus]|uniref:AAA+ ATPase domain-containing protein n=1 Tax=Hymenoscyphus fraxineus TaxID=746836 RepID=A0A9N9KS04_9HELO|nr:hypothetical protein HYFRA_00001181 [Hymenoscyphus fraxineus]
MDAPIRYKVIYEDDDRGLVREGEFSATDPGVTANDSIAVPSSVVLDILTYVEIFQQKYTHPRAESGSEFPFKIRKVRYSEMEIRSQSLIAAFRAVVKYYPKQTIEKDKISVEEPYLYVLQNMREIENYVEEAQHSSGPLDGENSPDQTGIKGFEIGGAIRLKQDFQILKSFIDKTWGRKIINELERYRQKPPMATFEMAWMLFKPGTKVIFLYYVGDSQHWMGGIIRRCELESDNERYKLSMWGLDIFRLLTQPNCISRRKYVRYMHKFPGEKQIQQLTVYPIELLVDDTQVALSAGIWDQLQKRGQKYFELMKAVFGKGSLEVTYDGELIGESKLKQYTGNAILAPGVHLNETNTTYRTVHDSEPFDNDESDIGSQLEGKQNERRRLWHDYREIEPSSFTRESPLQLTELHFFLSPPNINGFALRRKDFFGFLVDAIEPLTTNKEVLRTLQIPQDRLDMMTALTHRFEDNSKSWSADFIESKGEGLLFLLHGPSGVGKTYTAECISMYSGTEEGGMELKLAKWFSLAETWGAIMLIDEADVYFERRASGQLQRNSLVSAFLRSMEYYRGILFLTTNRLGHIDDAIISRIHLIIEYKDLTDAARIKIWKQFFTKLSKDRADYAVDPYLEGFVENDEKITSLKWNGREIRNAFQTAVSLAEYSAKTDDPPQKQIIVKKSHLEGVAEMSAVFKKYMKDFKGGAEKRAYIEGARMDDVVRQKKLQVEQARKLARQERE